MDAHAGHRGCHWRRHEIAKAHRASPYDYDLARDRFSQGQTRLWIDKLGAETRGRWP